MSTLSPPFRWIERDLKPRFPLLADKALEAYEIAKAAMTQQELKPSELSRLEDFCCDKSLMLRDWAVSVVAALSDVFPAATRSFESFVEDGRGDVAVSAIAALHNVRNESLQERVARAGLRHKSREVRSLAGSKVQIFRLSSLLNELAQAITAETDSECRASLEFSYHLLRDGYIIKRRESGAVYITVSNARSIVSREFSNEMVEEKGVDLLIEALKSGANF